MAKVMAWLDIMPKRCKIEENSASSHEYHSFHCVSSPVHVHSCCGWSKTQHLGLFFHYWGRKNMSMLTTIQSYPLKPQLLLSLSPHVFKTPGLSMPAAWYKPQEPGMVRCPATAAPPPEPPKIMTFPGSPPKLRMFSCTHRNASTCHTVPI